MTDGGITCEALIDCGKEIMRRLGVKLTVRDISVLYSGVIGEDPGQHKHVASSIPVPVAYAAREGVAGGIVGGVSGRISGNNHRQSVINGSQTLTTVPLPCLLVMSSRPRWRSTICFTIARPSPVPPAARLRLGSVR